MQARNAIFSVALMCAFPTACAFAQEYSQAYEPSSKAQDSLRVAASDPASAPAASSRAASSTKKGSGLMAFPVKVLGFVTGCAVGVPVNLVRDPIIEEKWTVNNWTGDNSGKPRVTVPAGIFWAPFALIDGVILAPFSAVKYSAKSFNDPFSKDQFSLGERNQ
jgi:hypothetical protein